MDQDTMDADDTARGVVTLDAAAANARDLSREFDWFARLLDLRFKLHFEQTDDKETVFNRLPPPDLGNAQSEYGKFVAHYQLSFAERTAVVLALVPHVQPRLLDVFLLLNKKLDRPFTEFGGVMPDAAPGFVPTGETLAFILAGKDLETRFRLLELFDPKHFFARHDLLKLVSLAEQPRLSGRLWLSEEYVSLFTTGQLRRPDYGAHFPAQYIETELDWDDLILHPATRAQIEEVGAWVIHGETLMRDWRMKSKLRPGYRALFHGPPGTGKTMAACLLGKSTGRDVYRIDLSLVVSK